MRTTPVSTEPSFLHQCFQVPVVRDRLTRGMKSLNELEDLKKFLEQHREEKLLRKDFGYLLQDLEFLESEGALKLPKIQPGRCLTTTDHWIALKGYFEVNDFDLENEGMARRFIINTPSVRTPIVVLDTDAWGIYNSILNVCPMTRYQALCYLVYILDVLVLTDSHFGDESINKYFVQHVVRSYSADQCLHGAKECFDRLQLAERVDDPRSTLLKLLNEKYCLPSNSWIFSDGFYFMPSLPSWSLVDSNYVESWDFFTAEV